MMYRRMEIGFLIGVVSVLIGCSSVKSVKVYENVREYIEAKTKATVIAVYPENEAITSLLNQIEKETVLNGRYYFSYLSARFARPINMFDQMCFLAEAQIAAACFYDSQKMASRTHPSKVISEEVRDLRKEANVSFTTMESGSVFYFALIIWSVPICTENSKEEFHE